MKPWMIAVVVVVVLAVGAGAFYGGIKFRESQLKKDPSALFSLMGDRQGQAVFVGRGNVQFPGAPGNGQTGTIGSGQSIESRGGTMGTIASIEGNVVTLKTDDGSSVKVQTSDTTLVQIQASVTVSELKVGDSVFVSGSKNDDGSITARSIQSMGGQPSVLGGQSGSN